jgi:uncharacterized protein YgbK (DUF1537 family)
MADVLVVADDLTGGNATGALFARRGLRAVTVSDIAHARRHAPTADVVVVNTQSRHVAAGAARVAVTAAIDAVPEARLVVKRVDTTLRGNVGAELEAALTAVRRRRPETRALFVPAFPAAGRTTVGGIHLVDGVPIAETDAARDPFSPVPASQVTTLLGAQTRLRTAEISLGDVGAGPDALSRTLDNDADIVICDAVTDAHLTALATAAAVRGCWLSADSGPFGAALATALRIGGTPETAAAPYPPVISPSSERRRTTVIVVAGSATGRTRTQLAETERALGARYVDVAPADLEPASLHGKLAALLQDAAVAGIRMIGEPVDTALAAAIPRVFGEVTRRILVSHRVGGVYATGGDVSVAVVGALGAEGFAVETEVQPLAVAGRLVGGPHEGLPFAAKGGLIGDARAAVDCVEHLRMATAEDGGRDRP